MRPTAPCNRPRPSEILKLKDNKYAGASQKDVQTIYATANCQSLYTVLLFKEFLEIRNLLQGIPYMRLIDIIVFTAPLKINAPTCVLLCATI